MKQTSRKEIYQRLVVSDMWCWPWKCQGSEIVTRRCRQNQRGLAVAIRGGESLISSHHPAWGLTRHRLITQTSLAQASLLQREEVLREFTSSSTSSHHHRELYTFFWLLTYHFIFHLRSFWVYQVQLLVHTRPPRESCKLAPLLRRRLIIIITTEYFHIALFSFPCYVCC